MAKVSYVITLLRTEWFSGIPAVALLCVALAWFLIFNTWLMTIDVREHRLPNRLTAALFLGASILLGASTLLAPADSVLSGRIGSTFIGGVGYCAVMFLFHLVTRGGIGMGDVKLAAGLGLYTGFLGVEAVLAGFVLAFVLGGVQAVVLMIARRATRRTRIAFGPAMILGALLVLLR